MQYYPENTVAKYKTQLEKAITLEGDWEVALFEIEYRRSWYTVAADIYSFKFRFSKVGSLKHGKLLRIPPGYYNSVDSLLAEINKAIADCCRGEPDVPVFSYDEKTQKVNAKLYIGNIFSFSKNICYLLGISDTTYVRTTVNGSIWIADERCDIGRGYESLYVYCDVLEHVPVGDTTAPLLRVVGVSGKQCEVVRQIFDKPLYVPVQKKHFESIEINICNDEGDIVPFEGGKSSVTLHFRLSKNPYFLP